jgi:hypothetical protein
MNGVLDALNLVLHSKTAKAVLWSAFVLLFYYGRFVSNRVVFEKRKHVTISASRYLSLLPKGFSSVSQAFPFSQMVSQVILI